MPETSVSASLVYAARLLPLLMANSNQPTKESKEKGLSALGADKKRPPGDSTCSSAAQRAQRREEEELLDHDNTLWLSW